MGVLKLLHIVVGYSLVWQAIKKTSLHYDFLTTAKTETFLQGLEEEK